MSKNATPQPTFVTLAKPDAALVAGLAAKLTEQPVSAGVDGDVVLGGSNTATLPTAITNTSANLYAAELHGDPSSGGGLKATGGIYAVNGTLPSSTPQAAGVLGAAPTGASTFGVLGTANSGIGVRGNSASGNGVLADSSSGVPILGQVAAGSSANTIAIYGLNNSTYAGPGPGAGGFAIYGLCAKGHGLVGATATGGGAAVVGAVNGVAGAYAGAFYGPVAVSGSLTVFGAKSAAVPHPDGSHRRLYCIESPESWFEDFGTGQLECGRAEIAIDPDFGALVDLPCVSDRARHAPTLDCQAPDSGCVRG